VRAPPAGSAPAPLSTSGDDDTSRRSKELALYARAEALGLCGPLGKRRADVWEGRLDEAERGQGAALVDELRAGIRRRVMRGADLGRVGTALSWFADFRRDTTRTPFLPLEHAGDISSSVYNAESLELLAEYMRLRGSRKSWQKGGAISADHIQATVATVRLLRSAEAHYGIIAESADTALSALYKDMRKDEGPKGERKESRAFRASHFRVLMSSGHDRTTPRGKREWCIALVAHNLLLRGGEVGRTTTKAFDCARDLTLTSVILRAACRESGGRLWLIVWVVSIKDPSVRFRAVPLPIMQRRSCSELCAYTALKDHVEQRWRQVPACAGACAWCKPTAGSPRPGGKPPATCSRANTPLFQLEDGSAYRTQDVRDLGARMAEGAGIPPETVGGKLFRIGGATDVRDALGLQAAERTLKDRGRWGSDVAFVYGRANMRDQLHASVAIGDADAREVEQMVEGWVQPATFR
jgi:hypothetical protein